MYDPEVDEVLDTCSDGKGVCKFPLATGQGFEVISEKIDYKISVPDKAVIPTPFAGTGHFHIGFLPDSTMKKIDIQLASSIVLSGFVIEMPSNKGAKKMKIGIQEQGIQCPEKWKFLWPNVDITVIVDL